jgi:phosphotransferase family enzyme
MRPPRELDAALPDVGLAFESDAVSLSLRAVWEAAERERIAVTRCTRADAIYEPGARCVVTYALEGESADGEPRETIGVVEVDASGPTYGLFRNDPRLPGLATAADAEAMRQRFAALPSEVANGRRAATCVVTPVRYKPAVSCVLRYELEGPARATFFAKLFAEGGDERLSVLAALHKVAPLPRILKPLAYWPDLQLLVQPAVEGAPLGETAFILRSSECARLLYEAGRSAAALTTVDVPGPHRTLDEDLRDLRLYRPLLAQLAPTLIPGFDEAVASIGGLSGSRPEPGPVPSHGALRIDQFLVEDDSLVLIDLDGFCWANPARDVANFLAYLDWRGIRLPATAGLVTAGREAFLAGYASAAPLPSPRWLELYHAASMLKIAGRRFRHLTFDEWELVPELIVAARAALAALG